MKTDLHIRSADSHDIALLKDVAAGMASASEADYFERSLQEQAAGKRVIFLADVAGHVAGYVQLNWRPTYVPFRRLDIPEIQDLNVLPAFRRQGIGARLIDHCEAVAVRAGKTDMGISVGLYASYGAAQRLYVRKGYVPDGVGVAYDDEPVRAGELRAVDDLLTLKLMKPLSGR